MIQRELFLSNGCPSWQKKGLKSLAQEASPAPKVRLRAFKSDDLPKLAALWIASWQETMPGINFAERHRWFLDHMQALHAAGSVTVCALDGPEKVVGFVSVDPATTYLDQLAVAPALKGAGVGRLLLNEAARISPHGIIVDVNEDNHSARAFYTREGFVKIGEGMNRRSGLKTLRLCRAGSS
jgi:putative acetyltransferase